MIKLLWEKAAQTDREHIYHYFFKHAGILLADKIDNRFQELTELLQATPYSGVKVKNKENYRKLIIPNFPFFILYQINKKDNHIRILRILHTATRLASNY
ncbi:type II toxin-antitoxin system RelE/ParE family toxin [Providencia vermicola]|uniref:type II toxin-antitoxin system RelE/ParE family toxin n=1 Tax=Providencia vermicola TaxID=333965 RepID=UPI003D27235B